MALPVRGFGGSIGIAEETVWGTEVARTNWMRMNTVGIQRKVTVEIPPLLGAAGSLSSVERADSYIGRSDVTGPLTWCLAYQDSSLMLLRHMFGSVADAGSGPYTHTYKIAHLPTTLPSLTINQISGTHATLSTAREIYGAKIGSWEISGEAGKQLMATADIVARSASSIQAIGDSPSYGTPTYILASELSTLFTANSVTEGVQKFSLKVNRNFQIQHELGSLFISEPIETRTTIELDLDMLWQKATPHTNYEAGNSFDYTWGFSNGSLAAAFTLFNGVIMDCDTPTTSAEGIRQSLKIRGLSDEGSGDQGLQLVITNANALYSAN